MKQPDKLDRLTASPTALRYGNRTISGTIALSPVILRFPAIASRWQA